MTVTLNGEPRQVPAGLTVAALLEHLGIQASRVAVERNGAVVQRAHHGETLVEAGDTLEVVRFVGGG
ncbi:MAG: sulfur carrier protein ThiS [Deltaproteobacteria bacterium]|nr:MAG: sulfur carrier protein ThiS [Deltaproteobacteria bacterium]